MNLEKELQNCETLKNETKEVIEAWKIYRRKGVSKAISYQRALQKVGRYEEAFIKKLE